MKRRGLVWHGYVRIAGREISRILYDVLNATPKNPWNTIRIVGNFYNATIKICKIVLYIIRR
jgi:hypothetical protein